MTVQQRSKTIVVESREDKTPQAKAKYSNNMFQLLNVGGTIDFASPGSFINPRLAKYTRAMKNILLQPTMVRSISMVNILTTLFSEIPDNMAERLSPLITYRSMHHITKNFASALISSNFQRTNLDSLNYDTNSITVLTFFAQNDMEKVNASREVKQVARNKCEFDLFIEVLGRIHSMD